MSASSGPGICKYKWGAGERMRRGLLWGRREKCGRAVGPQRAPLLWSGLTGPAFVSHEAEVQLLLCVLSWNSHYVAGIQPWPVMKLQTAGSSLACVTQEGKPLFWILALEHLPGLCLGLVPSCLPVTVYPPLASHRKVSLH